MADKSRRQFNQQMVGSLLTFSLLETLCAEDLFSAEVKPIVGKWLKDLDKMGKQLRGTKLTPIQWQQQVEALFNQIELARLLTFIDFKRRTTNFQFRDKGERSMRFKFPDVEGLPTQLVFGHQMFGMKKNQSVVPHGHNNMATAFLVLQGDFHGRHYDRLADDRDHMIIKPTIDQQFKAGSCSTVSDEKDNIHWFKATSNTGYLFNIHILNVKPGVSGRVYLDPIGEQLADGNIRARKIRAAEAYKLYG